MVYLMVLNVFSKHLFYMQDGMLSCISRKAPVLLANGTVKLIVLDSIAAPFRSDYGSSEMIKRAQHINNVGAMLCKYSHQYHIPVICINQVKTF